MCLEMRAKSVCAHSQVSQTLIYTIIYIYIYKALYTVVLKGRDVGQQFVISADCYGIKALLRLC